MIRNASIILAVVGGLLSAGGCAGRYAHFGDPMQRSVAATVTYEQVAADPGRYTGEFIRVSGTVENVCARKGCWLTLAGESGGEPIFVKFTCPTGDARLIPMDAMGHRAIVEGRLEFEELSEADARHLAEDAGKSADEIARISGVQKRLRMASSGARVYGVTGS